MNYICSDLDLSEDHVKEILTWSQDRINSLQDLVQPNLAFLWVIPSEEAILNANMNSGPSFFSA